MRLFKSIVLILFVVAVVVFALQNMELVKLKFLHMHLQVPLSFASIALYVLGALSGGLVLSMLRRITTDDRKSR